MQACIQSFLEAFSLFLVFSVQTKPNKMLHLNVSRSEQQQQQQQQKSFQRRNTPVLPNSNWFDRLCFLPFKQFFQVEVFEAIQHILTSRAGWKF